MTDKPTLSAKLVAQSAHDFLETPFGQHYIQQLSLQYNALHQDAESKDLTSEQKAHLIERAAGLKIAINYLTERDALLQSGYHDDEDTPAKQ